MGAARESCPVPVCGLTGRPPARSDFLRRQHQLQGRDAFRYGRPAAPRRRQSGGGCAPAEPVGAEMAGAAIRRRRREHLNGSCRDRPTGRCCRMPFHPRRPEEPTISSVSWSSAKGPKIAKNRQATSPFAIAHRPNWHDRRCPNRAGRRNCRCGPAGRSRSPSLHSAPGPRPRPCRWGFMAAVGTVAGHSLHRAGAVGSGGETRPTARPSLSR